MKGALRIFAIWTLFGLVFAGQAYLGHLYSARPLSWSSALLLWLPCGYAWAVLTPGIFWLNRRFPFERKTWKRALLVHIPASIVSCLLAMIIYLVAKKLVFLDEQPLTAQKFKSLVLSGFHVDLLIYGMVVGVSYAIDHHRRYRERELLASELQAQLARAQLATLKSQLHPHFLFNTLNTIAVLMEEDAKTARKMLVRLSDLLRMILKKEHANEISLKEEVELLESYLEIERMRFHDRLKVTMNIDPDALGARVPDLVLQPLVENAIKYGVVPRSRGGEIEIRVERQNGSLRLQVRDDGPGLKDGEPGNGNGLGLKNTKSRLEKLYGSNHNFEIQNADTGGLVVSMTIPFQRHHEKDSSDHRR